MLSAILALLSLVSLGALPSHGFSAVPVPVATNGAAFSSEEDCVREQLGYLPSNYVRVSAWKTPRPNADHRGGVAVVRVVNSTTTTTTAAAASTTTTTTTNDEIMIPVAIQTYPLNGGAKRRQNKARLPVTETRKQARKQNTESDGKSSSSDVVQSPFPTLFWLTCPDISKAVANLERRGFVKVFEDELNSDPELAQRLYRCHEEYAALRWKSLTEDDRAVLESAPTPSLQRMRNMMECSGISGTNFTDISSWDDGYAERLAAAAAPQTGDGAAMTAPNGNGGVPAADATTTTTSASSVPVVAARVPPIKCLHAHYAHYRSTVSLESTRFVNPVGELIHRQLQRDFPELDL